MFLMLLTPPPPPPTPPRAVCVSGNSAPALPATLTYRQIKTLLACTLLSLHKAATEPANSQAMWE